jgi:hypothetical protein
MDMGLKEIEDIANDIIDTPDVKIEGMDEDSSD